MLPRSLGLALVASLSLVVSLPAHAGSLGLIPEPKELRLAEGAAFLVGPSTRIVVGAWHAAEDRVAAETLADEARSTTGAAPKVTDGRGVPAATASVIYLARLADDPSLRLPMPFLRERPLI